VSKKVVNKVKKSEIGSSEDKLAEKYAAIECVGENAIVMALATGHRLKPQRRP
jgi:hypothetical protein